MKIKGLPQRMWFNARFGGLLASSGVGGVSFSPLSLFSASEPGVWLDPSDLTTMFQDAAGTTPVTADGQSVGLVLDKSKGLVMGPDIETDNWSTPPSGVTYSAGMFTFDGVTSQTNTVFSTNTPSTAVVVGRTYQVSFTIFENTTLPVGIDVGGVIGDAQTAPGTYTRLITATSTTGPQARFRNSIGFRTGSIGNISVREIPGNHATQATAAARPTYQVDSNGRGYLSCDGVDDWFITPTITPGTDKVQVFAGVRKLSDAAGIITELSASAATNSGSSYLISSESTGVNSDFRFKTRGTLDAPPPSSGPYLAPTTQVLAGLGDIAADRATLRIGGVQVAQSTADQGTGNFNAYPLYIGRRGGTTLPFNGRIYRLIVRFGANLTDSQITQTETWMNSKTGAY